jgi:hypothetical protein
VVGVLACTTALGGLPAAGAADTGLLRLAHLSPDTPDVDVYVDSVSDPAAKIVLTGVGYGTISGYQGVPPGTYTISMRQAGADPSTPPVLSTTVDVAADSAHTVAGVGYFASVGLQVLDDDLALPPAGQARVRVIDAAGSVDSLDVALPGGSTLASGLAFPQTGRYVDVPAGATALQITPGGGTATQVPVTLAAGSVYSVLVLDRAGGGVTVTPALDAASAPVVPMGGVETGAGGTAGSSATGLVAPGVAATAALALLVTFRDRLPRRGGRSRHAAGS